MEFPNTNTYSEPKGRFPAKAFVKEYILKRIEEVKKDPTLLTKDRKNLNRVFYNLRKKFLDAGWRFEKEFDKSGRRRSNVIAAIKEVCDELGIKRSDIGIVTDNVGYLYFRGRQYSVGIDQVKELVSKGTDIVIVEKQDMALSLAPYAALSGIALLSTRGFLTENAKDLQALSNEAGANIAILTDYDISGAVIAAKVPDVPRIGIDLSILGAFDIEDKQADVEEPYTPDSHHLKHIEDNPEDFYGLDLEYLKEKRIELDKVIEEVGNEAFWAWLMEMLGTKFLKRDYNRAVNLPSVSEIQAEELGQFNDLVDAMVNRILTPKILNRTKKLRNYKGFIDDVNAEEEKIKKEFKKVLDTNKEYNEVVDAIKELMGKLHKTES